MFDLNGFFTGPEFLGTLAQFISAFFTALAVTFLGNAFGQSG